MRSSGDDVDVDGDYDGDDWDMEEKDGDEEESWLAMEQIYWIENVVYAQKSDMTSVSTEILQCGRETNHSTDFSKCHIRGSSGFEALKEISNRN